MVPVYTTTRLNGHFADELGRQALSFFSLCFAINTYTSLLASPYSTSIPRYRCLLLHSCRSWRLALEICPEFLPFMVVDSIPKAALVGVHHIPQVLSVLLVQPHVQPEKTVGELPVGDGAS